MLTALWDLSAAIRGYLRFYMPTNRAVDWLRSPRGLKWAIPVALVATPAYLGADGAGRPARRAPRSRLAQRAGLPVLLERHEVRLGGSPGVGTACQDMAARPRPPRHRGGVTQRRDGASPLVVRRPAAEPRGSVARQHASTPARSSAMSRQRSVRTARSRQSASRRVAGRRLANRVVTAA